VISIVIPGLRQVAHPGMTRVGQSKVIPFNGRDFLRLPRPCGNGVRLGAGSFRLRDDVFYIIVTV
jgi:hypothetical protein